MNPEGGLINIFELMSKDNVLVVEDDKYTRHIIEMYLTKHKIQVKSAVDGEQALHLLKEFKPKVIISDWKMPVMNGIELCRYLKSHEEYKYTYFIIFTAKALLEDRIKGLESGADDFIVKPIENLEILARVRTGIRIFDLQEQLRKNEHTRAIIEIAATIGHKINNPLSSLLLSIQNIEDELDTKKSAVKEDLAIIKLSIEKIRKLVYDLIQLKDPSFTEYVSGRKMIKF